MNVAHRMNTDNLTLATMSMITNDRSISTTNAAEFERVSVITFLVGSERVKRLFSIKLPIAFFQYSWRPTNSFGASVMDKSLINFFIIIQG